jgi:acyl-CoA synthetase (AMP-forming)/AMP-acid ligase II
MSHPTLTALMQHQHPADRAIHYHSGDNQVRRVTYAELYQRALGMLFHLQQLGAKPGDHLILLLNNNEQFIDAFWGAILGGIVPVPVAIGISDEAPASCCASRDSASRSSSRPQDARARGAGSCSRPAMPE